MVQQEFCSCVVILYRGVLGFPLVQDGAKLGCTHMRGCEIVQGPFPD